ncbi:methyltransferase [Streptomyces sp. NBC_01023]|uniref:methyltransferase n=1 Tax=Streptomyces sp. NBC_01023 TaxID=2903724 RepID=UPI00386961C0|nr:methyltransferase [Streptomyces sp. NBC_01023]
MPGDSVPDQGTPGQGGLDGRYESVPEDFFEEVPAGADLYTIKHALHDWDDDTN